MDARTSEALIQLKSEGLRSIYFIDVGGLEILFRPLTFNEHETISDIEEYLDPASINEVIVKMAVVFSTHADGMSEWIQSTNKPFYIDHLAQKILDVSGFQNTNRFMEVLHEKRQLAQEVQSLIEIYICTAFKNITINEIRNMTLEDQLEFFTKAEEALGKPIDFNLIFKGPQKADKNKMYPPKPGMSTSLDDLLSPRAANKLNE